MCDSLHGRYGFDAWVTVRYDRVNMVPTRRSRPPRGKKKVTAPTNGRILLPRDKFLREARLFFDTITRPIIDSRTPRTSGREFSRQYTQMVDTMVGVLFQRAAYRHDLSPDDTGIAVIAMGGYGRTELAPYSDIDLLIVCEHKTRIVEKVAGSFTRLMWDAGFELGHAVEALVESEKALTQDMDTKTALVESRWVCGSRRVARALDAQIRRIRKADREVYLRRKIADAMARHERSGNSFQLIEPNVKLSPGGMRDFQTLVWLGEVGHRYRGLNTLERKGLLLRGERGELEDAYDFLLHVRNELHLSTKSRQDSLNVALQRKLARSLGYARRGDHLAVEFFMREYYTHTRAIFRITEDCLEGLGHGENVGVLLGRGRVKQDGSKLNVPVRRDRLRKDPLYVFELQKQTGKKLDRGLRRRMVDALQSTIKGAPLLRQMRRSFLDLVSDDINTALVVRSLHDTLFLMRIIPEYDRLTCMKRYDLYHHYTVDEHSFKVLENLTALGDPDADGDDPFVRLYSEISEKRPLILTALLHDVGKIEGRGHAKKGAALSQRILARMGLPRDEIEFVSTLIENHLVMSHFSQRRDPSDLGTITAFCDKVVDRTALKHLCLITYADYRATSPEVWTDWKKTLLWELYVRAYDFMARREKLPEQVYKQHKQRLLDAFTGKDQSAALAHMDLLPGGYLLNMTPAMVNEHMGMIASLNGTPHAVSLEKVGDIHRATFVTNDKPYRLSELCGVLTVNDFNILHAFAFTRKDGIVIDVFNVESANSNAGDGEIAAKVESIQGDLEKIFAGSLDLGSATTQHATRWRRTRKASIPIGVTVKFENDVSDDFTIIDVFTQDRPGLLYRITRALSSEGLTIFRANISTEATRAIDSFYVGDELGQKVSSASRLRRIREALEAEIDQPS